MSQPEGRSKRLREKQGEDGATKKMRKEDAGTESSPPRWKAHQMAQDLVDLSSNMMLHPFSKLGPYGYDGCTSENKVSYPLEHMSVLGYLKNPLRRPTVIECWSPYEIAMFEASVAEYGKDFYKIQKEIGATKSTKDVIEFYYIWKKTTHYTQWKSEYVPPYLDVSDDDETDVKKS